MGVWSRRKEMGRKRTNEIIFQSKMVRIFKLFMLCLLFGGCNQEIDIEGEIVSYYYEKCARDGCAINLNEITNFSWDKLYVFRYNVSFDEISSLIGQTPPRFSEFTRKLIFTHQEEIVHCEEHATNIEGLENEEIVFEMSDTLNYAVFRNTDSQFMVRKMESGQIVYFLLEKLNTE